MIQIRRCILSILNHPCSFMVYYMSIIVKYHFYVSFSVKVMLYAGKVNKNANRQCFQTLKLESDRLDNTHSTALLTSLLQCCKAHRS